MLMRSYVHSFICESVYMLICLNVNLLHNDTLICLYVNVFICSFVYMLICLYVNLFICYFVYMLICYIWIRLFICVLILLASPSWLASVLFVWKSIIYIYTYIYIYIYIYSIAYSHIRLIAHALICVYRIRVITYSHNDKFVSLRICVFTYSQMSLFVYACVS